jgi:hypothetical protein
MIPQPPVEVDGFYEGGRRIAEDVLKIAAKPNGGPGAESELCNHLVSRVEYLA